MFKRMLALLMVVVMVATFLPVSVLAEDAPHIHCECGKEKTLDATCENCGTKAVEWTGVDAMPTANGHYYLTKDISAELVEYGSGAEVSICLHGRTVTSTNGERILTAAAGGANVIITDCAENQGSLTGATKTKNGTVLRVNYGSTITMYGGRVTGNTAPSGGDGTIYVGEGTTAIEGGAFYMYGGEISGNTARRGGAFYIANPSSKKPGSVHILGGTITGNTASGTGNTKGGGAILAFGPVEVGGTAYISGNTATEGAADIYLRDSGYPGSLVISATKPMEEGALVEFSTDSGALTSVSGNPAEWNCHWLLLDGQTVSYANGAFVSGHYHGDQKYEPISGNAAVRDFTGYGYLTTDLKLGGPQTWKVDKHLCLNGHSITAKAGNRVFSTENASPVTIVIEDCSATTENGVYTAGKLTGGENTSGGGGCFNVAVGSKIYLKDGIITGNKSAVAAGAILNNGEFYMEGGLITGNEAKADGVLKNGAAIQMNSNGKFVMSGGEISGHEAAKGAAIYCNGSNSSFEFLGGTITGNSSTEGGAVFAGANVAVTISGNPVIIGNTMGEMEANLFLASSNTMQLGQLEATASVGISAETPDRMITAACGDYTAQITSDNDAYTVTYKDGALFLGTPVVETHQHNLCSDSTCTDHETVDFLPWTSTNSLPESGNYYLTEDVELTKQANLTSDTVNLCLNGHTVTVKEGNSLRFYYIKGNAQLDITDCGTTGTMTGATKSAIMTENVADSAPVINLWSGTLTGNKGESGGGAVMLQGKATFNMYGGKLTGNSVAGALGGGAVSQYSKDATFNMYGGEISGNTASKAESGKGGVGGAAYIRGAINLYGGIITDNTAEAGGGAIYLEAQAMDATITGNVLVDGNTAAGKQSNLHLNGQLLQLENLAETAKIGISGATAFQNLSQPCADYSTQITSDRSDWTILYQGGALYMDAPSDHNHCLCAATAEGCDHQSVKFAPWDKTDSLPTSGNYYLTADVALTKEISVTGDLTLCLNGFTVTAAENSRILSTPKDAGVTLVITQCGEGKGKLTGGVDTTTTGAGAIFLRGGNTMKLFGGEISGNTSVTAGGALVIAADAKLEIHGGVISNNSAKSGETLKNGGGVFLNAGAECLMTGGLISGNEGALGGGFYANNAKLTITGGLISGNLATQGGGAYCTGSSQLILTGGTIESNKATTNGGGFYMATGTQLTMEGGNLKNNTAGSNGGGLYILKQTVTLSGTIEGNSAAMGGGIYSNGAELTFANLTLSGNKASEGAGIYANTPGSGTADAFPAVILVDQGTVISNNRAEKNGGGILISGEGAKLTIKAGKITGNSAKNAGGVLTLGKSQLNLQGGEISGNTANSGAGVYISSNSKLTMTGGSISGNKATANAGGIYLLRCKATLQGGAISGNSGESGAGIYAAGSTVTITGTTVSGNKAVKNGGAMMALNSSLTANGVKTLYDCTINMEGGSFAGNSAINAGGVLVQGTGTVFNLSGGTITGNQASSTGGGVYVSTNGTFNMTGGAISKNHADKYGGGLWANLATVTLDAGEVSGNSVPTSGGGVVAANKSTVNLGKDLKVTGNTAKAAAGLLCQGRAVLTVDGSEVSGNISTALGGGLYVSTNSTTIVKNAYFHDNQSGSNGGGLYCNQNAILQVENTRIESNTAVAGGGVFNRGNTTIQGGIVSGNKAENDGGGLGSYKMSYNGGLFVDGTTISDNSCGGRGAGIFFSLGCWGSATNVTLTGNVAAAEGGALWAKDELTMENLTATGNTSGGEGYAVWLADSDYDGHSYIAGSMHMGGTMIIKDNKNGDLYLGEQTTIAIPGGVIGENTHVNITLASGLLTQKVFGQYGYEGGDQVYTITYGDRSMTDPERLPQEEPEQTPTEAPTEAEPSTEEADDTMLYLAIAGIAALILLAAVVLVIVKKKKAGKAAEK